MYYKSDDIISDWLKEANGDHYEGRKGFRRRVCEKVSNPSMNIHTTVTERFDSSPTDGSDGSSLYGTVTVTAGAANPSIPAAGQRSYLPALIRQSPETPDDKQQESVLRPSQEVYHHSFRRTRVLSLETRNLTEQNLGQRWNNFACIRILVNALVYFQS